jgi:hypothetical protein
MRFAYPLGFILILCGIAVAQQETNFPVGPQYLITQPYPTLLQPIATPSYPPSQPMGVVSPQTGEAGPVTITVPAYLPSVYWGYQSPYWGYPPPTETEVAPESEPAPVPRNLPQDYVDTGVSAIATPGWMHDRDYGMTLVQAARYWREHKPHATHTYTNQDIQRLERE